MLRVDSTRPQKTLNKERRAKAARRSSRWIAQWPPLLRDFTKERPLKNSDCMFTENAASTKVGKHPCMPTGDGRPDEKPSGGHCAPEGLPPMRFFGASPVVASALGIRLGATPRGRLDSNTHLRQPIQKGTFLLCWRGGHFYFALTDPIR